jgi:hypothetical protein
MRPALSTLADNAGPDLADEPGSAVIVAWRVGEMAKLL